MAPFTSLNPSAQGGQCHRVAADRHLPFGLELQRRRQLHVHGERDHDVGSPGINGRIRRRSRSRSLRSTTSRTSRRGPIKPSTQGAGASDRHGLGDRLRCGSSGRRSQPVRAPTSSRTTTTRCSRRRQPAIAPNGTLTYTPKPGVSGVATVTVQVRDNGGTIRRTRCDRHSDPQSFTITINSPPATQITFQGTDVWMSTSSSNRTFDFKAEMLKNGVPWSPEKDHQQSRRLAPAPRSTRRSTSRSGASPTTPWASRRPTR